jgi:hypothetical protein
MAQGTLKRIIAYYSKEDEFIVGEIDLGNVDVQLLRDLFGATADDPMYHCFPVKEEHLPTLQRISGESIDLGQYDYFVEAYVANE